jgi:hypothetical protein
MKKKNIPREYIVFTSAPAYPSFGCRLGTMRIPRGKSYREMLDYLPPTVGRGPLGTRALVVVRAYRAADARARARELGVRC